MQRSMLISNSRGAFSILDHLGPAQSGQGKVLHQKNGFLRADLLAIAAKNAAQHVDLEFPGRFLDLRSSRPGSIRSGKSPSSEKWLPPGRPPGNSRKKCSAAC